MCKEPQAVSILETTKTIDGYSLKYRLIPSREGFDIEIRQRKNGKEENAFLLDVARSKENAERLLKLLWEESVMPANALEIMEDLLSRDDVLSWLR